MTRAMSPLSCLAIRGIWDLGWGFGAQSRDARRSLEVAR
jgi:hypothetical protein